LATSKPRIEYVIVDLLTSGSSAIGGDAQRSTVFALRPDVI
jgi:hypothetical protein